MQVVPYGVRFGSSSPSLENRAPSQGTYTSRMTPQHRPRETEAVTKLRPRALRLGQECTDRCALPLRANNESNGSEHACAPLDRFRNPRLWPSKKGHREGTQPRLQTLALMESLILELQCSPLSLHLWLDSDGSTAMARQRWLDSDGSTIRVDGYWTLCRFNDEAGDVNVHGG